MQCALLRHHAHVTDPAEPWFSVRCILAFTDDASTLYEERVTLWRASSFEEAIERAEREAREYVGGLDGEYVGLAQAYHLADEHLEDGSEVFSMMRESELTAAAYITQFFDTGRENNGPRGSA